MFNQLYLRYTIDKPRYRNAKMSDVARVLLRPRNPAAQAALERLQGRSVTPEKVAEHDPAVKPSL